MPTEITLQLIYKSDPPEPSSMDVLFETPPPREVPVGIPSGAVSWYEATLWEVDQVVMRKFGYHAEDAIKEVFLAINKRTLELMLQAARRIER